MWGFPGGSVEAGETLADAAVRELREETGVAGRASGVVTALDLIDRDPAGALRVHYVLVAVRVFPERGEARAADDAREAAWCAPAALPAPLCDDVARVVQLSRPGS